MPLDPEIAMMLGLVRRAGRAPYWSMTAAEARTAVQRASRVLDIATRPLPRVDDHRIATRDGGEIAIRLYAPVDRGVLPALLYFHGGGFTVGGIATHDALCRLFAAEARCVVASVDYRLAPEHRFPTAVHDAQDALAWLSRHADDLEIDGARMAVGGDSAGGTLAAVTAIDARDRGQALALQMLIYPGTKRDTDTASHRAFAAGYILDERTYHWFMDQYAPDPAMRDDWRFAPLDGRGPHDGPVDLAGVAPAVVVTAGYDPVRDEGVAYAQRLAGASVAVRSLAYPGMIHGFLQFGGMIAAARAAHRDLVALLARAFAPDPSASHGKHP